MKLKLPQIHLKGIPVSRGIAMGRAFFFSTEEELSPAFQGCVADVEVEILRYRRAIRRSYEELDRLQKQLKKERIVEGEAILDTYLQLMKDPLLTDDIESEIRTTRRNAEYVFLAAIGSYHKRFSRIADPFFRERFKDIKDISKRIIRFLRESWRVSLAQTPPDSIVFAAELTASDVAEANISRVGGFVTTSGGAASHTAIVAKAKGIPYVTNISFEGIQECGGATAIIDGRTGDVFINPSPETIEEYAHLTDAVNNHWRRLSDFSHSVPETYDGYKMCLSANIEMVNEVSLLHQFGGHGVGLYRSEYEFLAQENFPSEDEQFRLYRRIVEMMRGLPIVIRTFDIGGDKQMLCYPVEPEENPIMGCRAIRFLLQEKEIFKSQLRAILRASSYGNVSILFPMVSALSELLDAKRLLKEVEQEMDSEGIPYSKGIRVGCMIEVPSAAVIADLLAKECDFLSIGTNDLVQYSLAVDRGNQLISGLYTPAHPSVLRLIKLVVYEANHEGIPVTVCGEIAGDPRFTSLLLGLGVHELSVAPRHLPIIKNAIRAASIVEATVLAEQAMALSSPIEIQELLNSEYRRLVPDDCFYNP